MLIRRKKNADFSMNDNFEENDVIITIIRACLMQNRNWTTSSRRIRRREKKKKKNTPAISGIQCSRAAHAFVVLALTSTLTEFCLTELSM